MKKLTTLILLITITVVANTSFGQRKISKEKTLEELRQEEDEKARGWLLGLNMGMIAPSGYPANFYNGSQSNSNKISLIIDNQYYRPIIEQKVGYGIKSYTLPANMSYGPNMSVGFYARFNQNARSAWFVQFNYQKLKANDVFFLNLDVPSGFSFDKTYLQCPIIGQEERTNIDFGYMRNYPINETMDFLLETGLNFSNTKVLKNMILIEDLEYSIKYVGNHPDGPYSTNNTYEIRQGGIGIGAFIGSGVMLKFNENISLDPIASLYWSQTNLEGYNAFKPSFVFFARFVFRNFMDI
jgi:hypothetical protein